MKILSILLLLALAVSCKTKKQTATADTIKITEKAISIQNCFIQKEVAGQEHSPPNRYMVIVFNNNLVVDVVLDSVTYGKSTYKLMAYRSQHKANLSISENAQSALLYYTLGGTPYFYKVNKIEVKEDIYLPSINPEENN